MHHHACSNEEVHVVLLLSDQFATQTCRTGRFGAEMGSSEYGAAIMGYNPEMDSQKVVMKIENVELYYVGQAFRYIYIFLGKITLEGSVQQRLEMLSQRETELLEEIQKNQTSSKRLHADRVHYKKKCDEKEYVWNYRRNISL